MSKSDLMIVLTTGKQDRGTRATLALSWGCTALAMGQKVTLFLTMDGAVWAMRGSTTGVKVLGFEPLEDYLEQFVLLGGTLLLCAPCAEYYCSFDVEGSVEPGVELVGLATVVSQIKDNGKVVTF